MLISQTLNHFHREVRFWIRRFVTLSDLEGKLIECCHSFIIIRTFLGGTFTANSCRTHAHTDRYTHAYTQVDEQKDRHAHTPDTD